MGDKGKPAGFLFKKEVAEFRYKLYIGNIMEGQPRLEKKAQITSSQEGIESSGVVSPEEQERLAFLEKWEKSCTPEQTGQIMNKAQDLGKEGIAYHSALHELFDRNPNYISDEMLKFDKKLGELSVVEFIEKREEFFNSHLFPKQLNDGLERLRQIFAQGIIGKQREDKIESKEDYHKFMKKDEYGRYAGWGPQPVVYFNITGRARDVKNQDGSPQREAKDFLEIGQTMWTFRPDNITVIFDHRDLQETLPPRNQTRLGHKKKISKNFTADDGRYIPVKDPVEGRNLFGDPIMIAGGKAYSNQVASERGFITGTRIPPRKFQGVVYSPIKKQEWVNYKAIVELYTDEELQRMARNIAAIMVMVDEKTPERILPVYDSRGRLLWPQQMGYEEVKSFVESKNPTKGNTTGDKV